MSSAASNAAAAPAPGLDFDPVRERRGWWIAAALVALTAVFVLATGGERGPRLTGVLGLVTMLGLAVAMSSARRQIRGSIVAWGVGLQLLFGFIVLRTAWGSAIFGVVAHYAQALLNYTYAGSTFVFGALGAPNGGNTNLGVVFAFQVLPTIIFIAALMAMLYYLGVMQVVVRFVARIMMKCMRASGAESLSVAASIFMGQTEAPLTIRPFLENMTESELFTVMAAGMAHVSGAIMGAYVLVGHVELRHLLTAVIMTAPATIMLAKIMVPETGTPQTMGKVKLEGGTRDVNLVDAASRGIGDGLFLALNVGAMLIGFVALIALSNGILGKFHTSLQTLLGYGFSPIAWVLGVPWHDAPAVGSLLGTRMVLNEFVAFTQLGPLHGTLAPRSFTITTFALCGFANLSSIGIQIGGIGSLAPGRKHDLARLGVRAMLCGTLANFMSAAIAGILLY